MPSIADRRLLWTGLALLLTAPLPAQELGARWGTAQREREHYRIVPLPIPEGVVVEAGAMCTLPDGRMAIGTRRGDVLFVDGIDEPKPEPRFHTYATGLDEIFGLAWQEDSLLVTQSCELTRLRDRSGDGRADDFEAVSAAWGYENYHEYAFGSPPDAEGNVFVALGLSASYHSHALFRGWTLKITPSGEAIPFASGLRSPGDIGFNEHGSLFYVESQGPWNCSCSLKAIPEGGFMGHPASFNWYPYAPERGDAPTVPEPRTRIHTERERVPELVPYAVIFPYIRMGRSISGFTIDRSGGAFGPFDGQLFVGDYSLSLVMRATTERVDGVWQGACYPFREGLSTGLLDVHFTPEGKLLTGGTNRGWPVRGLEPYALERIEWTGVTPFEVERISITPTGFDVRFTLPLDAERAAQLESWKVTTFTHPYRGAYGGPEVDQTEPEVTAVSVSEDRLSARIELSAMTLGHVHEFDLARLRSEQGVDLVHSDAYYTVNAVPTR